MPCHNRRLNAYTPARAFNLSTLRTVQSGIVNRTDFLSREANARYGGIICSFPAFRVMLIQVSHFWNNGNSHMNLLPPPNSAQRLCPSSRHFEQSHHPLTWKPFRIRGSRRIFVPTLLWSVPWNYATQWRWQTWLYACRFLRGVCKVLFDLLVGNENERWAALEPWLRWSLSVVMSVLTTFGSQSYSHGFITYWIGEYLAPSINPRKCSNGRDTSLCS